ncbi:MAG: hypothetical protein J5950_02090 [Clostridia bacterium]|nr:hypothetical protein [Clostridia bacterium]
MTEVALMAFINRILRNGSEEKARLSLLQLLEILRLQGADPEHIQLVRDASLSVKEARPAANRQIFVKQDLIAAIRASEKRRREEEMSSRGRC